MQQLTDVKLYFGGYFIEIKLKQNNLLTGTLAIITGNIQKLIFTPTNYRYLISGDRLAKLGFAVISNFAVINTFLNYKALPEWEGPHCIVL